MDLGQATRFVVLGFLAALAAIVFTGILNGRINARNLLSAKGALPSDSPSPERVQLLAFTLWTALSYLLDVIDHAGSGVLPDVPETTLYLLGGSHALYLGGKAYAMLRNPNGPTA